MLWKIDTVYGLKLDDLDWDKVKEFWPLASESPPKSVYHMETGPTRLSDDEVMGLIALGFDMKPVPYPGAMITKMQDREKWDYGARVTPEHLASGAAVQITIPDFGLLYLDEVQVLEDACTNSVQYELDAGWRILAVCPPNAARRPDYILGRRKPKE